MHIRRDEITEILSGLYYVRTEIDYLETNGCISFAAWERIDSKLHELQDEIETLLTENN